MSFNRLVTRYTYVNGSQNTIRPTSLAYPNGRVIGYDYGSGIDDAVCRVRSLVDNGTQTLAEYSYLGGGAIVQSVHPQPSLTYTLIGSSTDPDTGDIYVGLDRFGRIKDCRWVQGTSTDVDRYKYGYDRVGNRRWRENVVARSLSEPFDELYSYDGLYRRVPCPRREAVWACRLAVRHACPASRGKHGTHHPNSLSVMAMPPRRTCETRILCDGFVRMGDVHVGYFKQLANA